MSKTNPYIPAELNNIELARDMRIMASRLEVQADRFRAANVEANMAALVTAESRFRIAARYLRSEADVIQPSNN